MIAAIHRPALAVALLLPLALGSPLLLSGCTRDSQARAAPQPRLPVVETAPVVRAARSLPIRTSGRLAEKEKIQLSFKIGGIIGQLLVEEGQSVHREQVLARLEPQEIDAQVLRARTTLNKARRDLERAERLQRDSVATLENVQDARTRFDLARAALRIAEFNHRHATIVAPADGRILRRRFEASELIAPGEPVFVLGATRAGWVARVGLADRDIVRLHPGDRATIALDAHPDHPLAATVSEIAAAADPLSGTFEVELTLAATELPLKSGFIARVDLYPQASVVRAFVPVEALVWGDGDQGIVYGVADGIARRLPVRIARLLDTELAIASGLEGFDQIITRGSIIATDGDRVVVAASL